MANETNQPQGGAPMLRIADLNVYYGAIHALKGISLEVHQGESLTLGRLRRKRRSRASAFTFAPVISSP